MRSSCSTAGLRIAPLIRPHLDEIGNAIGGWLQRVQSHLRIVIADSASYIPGVVGRPIRVDVRGPHHDQLWQHRVRHELVVEGLSLAIEHVAVSRSRGLTHQYLDGFTGVGVGVVVVDLVDEHRRGGFPKAATGAARGISMATRAVVRVVASGRLGILTNNSPSSIGPGSPYPGQVNRRDFSGAQIRTVRTSRLSLRPIWSRGPATNAWPPRGG